jgi:hypothetical protein
MKETLKFLENNEQADRIYSDGLLVVVDWATKVKENLASSCFYKTSVYVVKCFLTWAFKTLVSLAF